MPQRLHRCYRDFETPYLAAGLYQVIERGCVVIFVIGCVSGGNHLFDGSDEKVGFAE